MTPEICEHETAVLAALAAGTASSEIERHLKTCAACREADLVRRYLQASASSDACDVALPSADLIWWRAQLAEKRRLAARSVAAIELVQKAAIILVTAFFIIAGVLWGAEVFRGWTLSFPLALAALLLLAGSIGAVLYAWFQGHSMRLLARQR